MNDRPTNRPTGRPQLTTHRLTPTPKPKTKTKTTQVLLTGGAIQSPHLLMLSGIGPAAELKAVGVEPKIDRPGVGSNLQDHPAVGASCLVLSCLVLEMLSVGCWVCEWVLPWCLLYARVWPSLAWPGLVWVRV
jgi:hypothetical protein